MIDLEVLDFSVMIDLDVLDFSVIIDLDVLDFSEMIDPGFVSVDILLLCQNITIPDKLQILIINWQRAISPTKHCSHVWSRDRRWWGCCWGAVLSPPDSVTSVRNSTVLLRVQ